jgi:dihydroorotate dehydrogenase
MRRHRNLNEAGGLSGWPLFTPSTELLRDLYRLTEGKLTLVGTGGVGSGLDAYKKIRAGASLVQLYTALVYGGPGLVARIAQDLAACLRNDGFASVDAAVGADHRTG